MTQRGFVIPVMLIVYGLMALAALAAVGVAKYKLEHWCNATCRDARGERDKLAAEKAAALKREAAIATLYGAQVAATQAAEAKQQEVRDANFGVVRSRVARLGADDAHARIPAGVVGLLNDATSAANASGAAPGPESAPATPSPGADTSGALLAGWFAVVAEIHAECRDRVQQWADFYRGLKEATSEQIH